MSEEQAYFNFPTYLTGKWKYQFTSMKNGIRAGGIKCLPEGMQLFIRSYPDRNVIWDAVCSFAQYPSNVDWRRNRKTLNDIRTLWERSRPTNHHEDFVNDTQCSICRKIERFREERHRDEMNITRLAQEAQDVGNTFRLQMEQLHRGLALSARAALTSASATRTPKLFVRTTSQWQLDKLNSWNSQPLTMKGFS